MPVWGNCFSLLDNMVNKDIKQSVGSGVVQERGVQVDPFRSYAPDVGAAPVGPAPPPLDPKANGRAVPKLQPLAPADIAETPGADEAAGELALLLLDMMFTGSTSRLPHERTLAADTLLLLLPRLPARHLLAVAERVAIMEAPPPVLVANLIRDPRAEIVAPLLERCMHITDQDLIVAATEGDGSKRRMMAHRRIVSPVLADHLIAIGDASTLLTLARNPGAEFSFDALMRLTHLSHETRALLVPLSTRPELPAPVAFELFWLLPPELRRYIMSRFLTDSQTLTHILRIAMTAQNALEARFPSNDMIEFGVDLIIAGELAGAAAHLAEIAGIHADTAMRILADVEGEPLAVLLKALGYSRAALAETLPRLASSGHKILRPDRNIMELQGVFDSLSFNKARVLLLYWDWFTRKSGPYVTRQ